jgi:hypothetical protein
MAIHTYPFEAGYLTGPYGRRILRVITDVIVDKII